MNYEDFYKNANEIRKEIKCKNEEIEGIRKDLRLLEQSYQEQIHQYRIDSVSRVLDFIRTEYRAGRLCDLEILLCHCQNKLYGNIDGTDLDLDEHLMGKKCVLVDEKTP